MILWKRYLLIVVYKFLEAFIYGLEFDDLPQGATRHNNNAPFYERCGKGAWFIPFPGPVLIFIVIILHVDVSK